MKMAIQNNQILLKDVDMTQRAVIKSWNKFKWNKSTLLYVAPLDMESLDRLASLVRLPESVEAIRQQLHKVQDAVDRERVKENPVAYVKPPVKVNMYEHQTRAMNMALLTFGMLDPEVQT